jgi:hypothetical protein
MDKLKLMVNHLQPFESPNQSYLQLVESQQSIRKQYDELIGELMVEMENELQLQHLGAQIASQMSKSNQEILKVFLHTLTAFIIFKDPNTVHALKKDVLAFEDQTKEAVQSRKHVQRAQSESPADSITQVGIMLEKINELDSLVTLKDKFMEQKTALEAKIKEAKDRLKRVESQGLRSAAEVESEREELNVS